MNYTLTDPTCFTVWVTCMLPDYENHLLAGMVKKGYQISPAASSGQVTITSGPSAVICFKVESSKENIAPNDISKDVIAVLLEQKALYYSVVVSVLAASAWNTSNISLPKKPSPPPPTVPEPNKSNLN